MTRSSLDTTLRRAYIVLGLVLLIAIAAKFADRIPGIEGTALARMAADTYEFLKDMSLVLVTVIAAYLANVFQKRSKFIERLEEEWRGIVRTKSALYSFCEKPNASRRRLPRRLLPHQRDDRQHARRLRERRRDLEIDRSLSVRASARHAPRAAVARSAQALRHLRRRRASSCATRSCSRSMRCGKTSSSSSTSTSRSIPILVSAAARRRKHPGATSAALKMEVAQLDNYERDAAPRRAEVEALLWALHAKEQAG